jgi:hypothetical protein
METIMISPTNKASQRTKNRIRENGPVFQIEQGGHFPLTTANTENRLPVQWLLRAAPPHKFGAEIWMGWLPRDEFHVECVGEKFIKKVMVNP